LVELLTQVDRYKNYWDQQSKTTSKNQQIYVALGDSTAQGIGASNPDKGYVGVIARELSKQRGDTVSVVNLSKSGARIKDVLNTQLPQLKTLNLKTPPIVTIEIGANDMAGFEPTSFELQVDALMSQIPKQTVMSDVPYFGSSRHKKLEVNVQEANKIMNKLANKHGIKLAKLHDRIKQNDGLKIFAADLFHPSDYSYRENWAYIFLKRLQD
jgi:lysophospholipase L1-like esterase